MPYGLYHTFLSVPDFSVLIAAKSNWCKRGLQREGVLNRTTQLLKLLSENLGLKEQAQEDVLENGNSLPHIFSVDEMEGYEDQ